MREKQQNEKQAPRYDRACRDMDDDKIRQMEANGMKYVIRQKMPLEGEVIVKDELRGEIKFKASDLDDQILIKSNGIPTYQFANVVDDHLMKISHVLRGEEWIPSLPKNILLYKSFGWEAPIFIHSPLILNKAGGKLSKRDGDVTVEAYKDNGYLPEALINYLMLLGWHPKGDEEILSLDEIIKKFEIKDIGISGAVFDSEKLDYFNGHYIREKNIDELVELCLPFLDIDSDFDKDYIKKAIGLAKDRMKKLSDVKELTSFFFVDVLEYEKELLIWKKLSHSDIKNNLENLSGELGKVDEKNWEEEKLQEIIITYIKSIEGKNGDYLWPMRASLTGEKASPSPFEVAGVLGKERSLKRIKEAISKF
jgi:glutamyl-tRNA synthetase